MKIIILIALSVLISSCMTTKSSDALSPGQVVFYSHEGYRVMCQSAERKDCGLRLSSCDTGMIYECTKDVVIFDSDEFKNSLLKNYVQE